LKGKVTFPEDDLFIETENSYALLLFHDLLVRVRETAAERQPCAVKCLRLRIPPSTGGRASKCFSSRPQGRLFYFQYFLPSLPLIAIARNKKAASAGGYVSQISAIIPRKL